MNIYSNIFLVVCVVKLDTLYNLKPVENEEQPFYTTKNEMGTFLFFDNLPSLPPYKIQHHLPFLLQNLLKINEPIIHHINSTKYEVRPFKDITMENKHGKALLGKYTKSVYRDGIYSQVFECGDMCDLNKKKKRAAVVAFKGISGELRVESIVEKKLCSYHFEVGGESLVRNIDNNLCIGYKFLSNTPEEKNKENDEKGEKNETDEKEKQLNMEDILKLLQEVNFDEMQTEKEKEDL
ncbi:hypothetical protein BDAP_002182 [Binucleata daphniae]